MKYNDLDKRRQVQDKDLHVVRYLRSNLYRMHVCSIGQILWLVAKRNAPALEGRGAAASTCLCRARRISVRGDLEWLRARRLRAL